MSLLNYFGSTPTHRIKNACTALQKGSGIILVDDEHRENEGDLIFAAEHLILDQVNQLIQDCSGIICLSITEEKAKELSLTPMVYTNTNKHQTACNHWSIRQR